jgi:hypothetical protein
MHTAIEIENATAPVFVLKTRMKSSEQTSAAVFALGLKPALRTLMEVRME